MNVGDKVEVTLEGVVTATGDGWFDIAANTTTEGHNRIFGKDGHVHKVEVVKEAVEVFGVGDVVRSRHGGAVFALDLDGDYLVVKSGYSNRLHWPKGHRGWASEGHFTSERFERVPV